MSRIRDIANILSANTDMATDAEVTSSIASHAAAADPHTVYLKESEFNAAGKNIVVNGGFDVWQRGTSVAYGTVAGRGADCWIIVRSGWAGGATMSRQTGTAESPYCARVQRDSGNTSTSYIAITNSLESINCVKFAGKQITFSFYARKGANYSEASSLISYSLNSGTGTDQNITTTGLTGQTALVDTVATITTSWQRFSWTGTVPSNSNQLAVGFAWTPVGTAGAADYFEITNVQIELGTAATPFTRVGGNPAGEYALCQRYYQVIGDNIYELINGGYMQSGNSAYASWTLPVEMRTTPTGTKVGNWAVFNCNQPTLQASWPGGFSMQSVCNTTGHYYFHSNTTYYITMLSLIHI